MQVVTPGEILMKSMPRLSQKPLIHLLIATLLLGFFQSLVVPQTAHAGSVSFGSDTGSGFGTVSIPYDAKLDVGDGAFNLEMWVKEISRSPMGGQYTASFWSSTTQHFYHERNTETPSFMWGLSFDGPNFFAAWRANQNYFYPAGSDTGYTDVQTSSTKTAAEVYNTFADAEFHHIALSKTGVNGVLSMYLDGVRVLYVPNDNQTYSLLGGNVVIGGFKFVGQIGDVRLVKGQALYTGPSITVPTSQITTTSQGAIASNVSLLLKASGNICAVADFSDNHFPVLLNGATCSLAATRSISSYNVQFDNQGHGTKPADAIGVTSIALADLPSESNDGYFNFQGWSETTTGAVLTDAYAVTADSTLYAIWQDNSPITHTVTYDLDNGVGTLPIESSVAEGESFTVASSSGISKAGYTFIGWSDAPGSIYAQGSSYNMGTANVTLTAQWSSDSIPVTYNSNGGSPVSGTTVVIGESITAGPTNPTKAGFIFVKWQQSGVDIQYPLNPTHETLVDVSFPYYPILSTDYKSSVTSAGLDDLGRYENKGSWDSSIWYGPNRGTSPASTRDYVTYIDGTKYVAIRESVNALSDKPTGPRLNGYYIVPLDTSVTLNAVWSANPTRTITYNLGGGVGTTPTQGDVAEGASFIAAASIGITKPGFSFDKWSDGSANYAPGDTYTVSTNNITLTATWTANPTRTITYNLDGGRFEYNKPTPTQAPVAPGSKFTVASSKDLEKKGYTFGGWSDGSRIYKDKASYTMGSSNVVFTAVWIAKQYKIAWNIKSNGGASGGVAGASKYTVGAPITTLPTNAVRPGKVFKGWCTSANGGTKITSGYLVATPFGDVTFYAQFA